MFDTNKTQLSELKTKVQHMPCSGRHIFWDQYLTSQNYFGAFGRGAFDFDTFWPTKDIVPVETSTYTQSAVQMFYNRLNSCN